MTTSQQQLAVIQADIAQLPERDRQIVMELAACIRADIARCPQVLIAMALVGAEQAADGEEGEHA